MNPKRTAAAFVAFAALGGSIAWGLLGEAAAYRRQAVLDAIQKAEETLSFSGVRTITIDHPDGAATTVLKVRGRDGARAVEFVETRLPNGEVVRREETGPFGFTGRIRGALAGCAHEGRLARFNQSGLILRNYDLAELGRDAVAGRAADCYELRARHPGRASYRLWADSERRLLLRFQAVSPRGNTVFDSSHESIRFDAEEAAPPAPRRVADIVQRHAVALDDLRGLGFQAWLPARPPEGFELRSLEVWRAKKLFEGLLAWYHDGMASVLVIQFRADNPVWQHVRPRIPPFASKAGREAVKIEHEGGTLVNVQLDGTEIFVVGQLGGGEIERAVQSLKRVN